MKKIFKYLFLLCFSISLVTGCNKTDDESKEDSTELAEWVDYVAQCKLDLNSGRAVMDATVRTYVDGDTTHFIVNDSKFEGSVLKARYLAIDTPESTGKVQPYGKAASNFTKNALSSATSIKLESATDAWNTDSTGSRYLCWVWYKTSSDTDYKLLNLELLQNGYTGAKNYSSYEYYATYFSNAMSQAMAYNLRCLGTTKDPDYWYGGAQEITLKELRLHSETYKETKVRVECTVGKVYVSNGFYTAYVYDYDQETDITYGFQVYLLTNYYEPFKTLGNRISLCGTCLYYETGHVYQLSDVSYNRMKAFEDDTYIIEKYEVVADFNDYKVGDYIYTKAYNSLANTYKSTTYLNKVDNKAEVVYKTITADDLSGNTKVNIVEVGEDESETTTEYSKPALLLHSLVTMASLTVKSISTTTSETSSSKGAMTLHCRTSGNEEVNVRTAVLYDENFDIVKASAYNGKKITVTGILDYYSYDDEEDPDGYQIRVFTTEDIIIQ